MRYKLLAVVGIMCAKALLDRFMDSTEKGICEERFSFKSMNRYVHCACVRVAGVVKRTFSLTSWCVRCFHVFQFLHAWSDIRNGAGERSQED